MLIDIRMGGNTANIDIKRLLHVYFICDSMLLDTDMDGNSATANIILYNILC